jgi:hypothetical protein
MRDREICFPFAWPQGVYAQSQVPLLYGPPQGVVFTCVLIREMRGGGWRPGLAKLAQVAWPTRRGGWLSSHGGGGRGKQNWFPHGLGYLNACIPSVGASPAWLSFEVHTPYPVPLLPGPGQRAIFRCPWMRKGRVGGRGLGPARETMVAGPPRGRRQVPPL